MSELDGKKSFRLRSYSKESHYKIGSTNMCIVERKLDMDHIRVSFFPIKIIRSIFHYFFLTLDKVFQLVLINAKLMSLCGVIILS